MKIRSRLPALAAVCLLGAFALAIPVAGACSAAQKQTEAQGVAEGCALVGVVDPAGQTEATICENAAPAIVSAVDEIVKAVSGGKLGATSGAPAKFVPLVVDGKLQGYVRPELLDAVQAKIGTAKK